MIVSIDKLQISLDNPRGEKCLDVDTAIVNLVRNQKAKLYTLAEDICKHGLLNKNMLVYPNDYVENGYCVADGNRRLLAIQILTNPEIISKIDDLLYEKFIKLQDKYIDKITEIDVQIFDSLYNPTLVHILEITHDGDKSGMGTVQWGAYEKERFRETFLNQPSRLNKFHEMLISLQILSKEDIRRITKTNWERLLGVEGLNFLNLKKTNDEFILPADNAEFSRRMRAVANKLRDESVAIVYDKNRKIEFFNNLRKEMAIKDETQFKIPIDHQNNKPISPKLVKNIFSQLNYSCLNKLEDKVLIKSCIELKELSKNYEYYSISCTVMVRCIFENALKRYLNKYHNTQYNSWILSNNNKDLKLSKYIEQICKSINNGIIFFQNKTINDNFIEYFSSKNSTLIENANAFLHNPETMFLNPNMNKIIEDDAIYKIIDFLLNYSET